jgi:hypothetical protein
MRLGFVLFFILAACSSKDQGPGAATRRPDGSECSVPTHCASGTCLLFRENKQRKTGMCTTECTSDLSCGQGAICVVTQLGGLCMRLCNTNLDCKDGFVCTTGRGAQRVCGVEPVNSGPVDPDGCTTEVYGSCIRRSKGECVEKGGVDASQLEGDKKECEAADPNNIWSDGPCPLLDLVGGCRQGCDRPATVWYYASGPYATAEDVEKACTAAGSKFVKP